VIEMKERQPTPAELGSPARREFLSVAGATAAAGALGGVSANAAADPSRPEPSPGSRGTVLAIGAHYDDCAFGIPGTLLQAVAKGYRVVTLSLIGDYTNWKPVRGRAEELLEGARGITSDYGAEARFLDYASGRLPVTEEGKRAIAAVVAEVRPDIAFMLWPHDQHPDHEVASELSQAALRLGDRLLEDPFAPFRPPRRIYLYDNGPRHTIGFEPNTFVDVTREWPRAIEWLGRLMALVRNEEYDPNRRDGAQEAKETLARYRGATCGVEYAEALASANAYPRDIWTP
jgi:LmbE family N-acetylglucosaminyl deacetylase